MTSDRISFSMGFYEVGHMMYVHTPSRAKLADDARQFVKGAAR